MANSINGGTFFIDCGAADACFNSSHFLLQCPRLRATCSAVRRVFDEGLQLQWNILRRCPPKGSFLDLDQEIKVIDATLNCGPMDKFYRLCRLFAVKGVDARTLFGHGYLPCGIQDIARMQRHLTQFNQDRALIALWKRTLLPQQAGPAALVAMRACKSAAQMRTYLADPDNHAIIMGIINLNLSRLGLNCLPQEIGAFTGVMTLNLNDNQLKELPIEIGRLTQLWMLELSNNQLKELPREMGSLSQLRLLDLSNNHLTRLPIEISSLTLLTMLSLFHNQFVEIPEVVCHLRQLKLPMYINLLDNPGDLQ